MGWFDLYKDLKVDIKDLLAIVVSLISIFGATNKKVQKAAKWIWSKTMGPIIDRISGRAKTNQMISELSNAVQGMARAQVEFQSQNVKAMTDLSHRVDTLQKGHEFLISEFNPKNGGNNLKEVSNMTFALLWTILNEKEDTLVLHTDEKGMVKRSNKSFRSVTGKESDQIKETGWLNCIAEKDRQRVWNEFNDAVKAGRDYESSYHLIDSEKNEFEVESRATRLTDQKGNIIGYLRMIKLVDS